MVDEEKDREGRRDKEGGGGGGDVRGLGRLLGPSWVEDRERRGFKGVLDVSREGWRGN